MARHKKHEDHANHEAWAIPYGDLLTLLLALFVVLYSMSSVNEGKYRVLSDSLNEAFGGRPRSPSPIQIGENAPRGGVINAQRLALMPRRNGGDGGPEGAAAGKGRVAPLQFNPVKSLASQPDVRAPAAGSERNALEKMADDVQRALGDLIDRKLVTVRRTEQWLEIEMRTDILFPSGVARLSPVATPVLDKLAGILAPFPNLIRVEGHTDDLPIATAVFPSNWELSAARAASVVTLFVAQGVEPSRLSVVGYGEHQPITDNDTAEGRNRNRRVVIVVINDPNHRTVAVPAGSDARALPGPVSETHAPLPAPVPGPVQEADPGETP